MSSHRNHPNKYPTLTPVAVAPPSYIQRDDTELCGCMHFDFAHRNQDNSPICLFVGTMERMVLRDEPRPCLMLSCTCPDYEPDNLKYLQRIGNPNV